MNKSTIDKKEMKSPSRFLLLSLTLHFAFTFCLRSQIRVESTESVDSICPLSVHASLGTLEKFEMGVSYKVSQTLTIGIHRALLLKGAVYGVHSQAQLAQIGQEFSLLLSTPLEYYPPMAGIFGSRGALFLWPVFEGQWKVKNVKVSAGVGLVCAAWLETIEVPVWSFLNPFEKMKQERKIPATYLRNSIHAGISIPVWKHVSVEAEAGLILSGLSLESQNWIGRSPLILRIKLNSNIW